MNDIDEPNRQHQDAAATERDTLQVRLANVTRERDALLIENAELHEALEEARIGRAQLVLRALDGLAADAELAERKARRRQASAKTGTKSNPTLEFSRDWVYAKVLAGAHKSHQPAQLHWMLIREAEQALGGKGALVPNLDWLEGEIRKAKARVEEERMKAEATAAAEAERERQEAEAVECQRRLDQSLSRWMPANSFGPNSRRSSP